MQNKNSYFYTERELLKFKVPEVMVWPFIGVLAILLMGESVVGPEIFLGGKNIFFLLGLFYLFQGLGVFIDLLSLFKVRGFFKSILVVMTIITSYYLLAALGLFDMWVDFRTFFKKRLNNRGDNS